MPEPMNEILHRLHLKIARVCDGDVAVEQVLTQSESGKATISCRLKGHRNAIKVEVACEQLKVPGAKYRTNPRSPIDPCEKDPSIECGGCDPSCVNYD